MGANYRGYNPVTGDDVWTIAGEMQVASGGALNVESGGEIEIKSLGSFLAEAGAIIDIGQGGEVAVAGHGIHLDYVWTYATSGAFKAVVSELSYEPVQGGYGTPIAVVGKVSLGEGAEFTGSQGAMYGVQGQLNFMDGATVNDATSIFAALRGVITSEGTPVFTTASVIAGLYIDNLCAVDITGGQFGSALAALTNHGSAIDHAIFIYGERVGAEITNLFSIQGDTDFITATAHAAGAEAKIKMLWGSTVYYININQA